jgi:hypothetical protein
MTSPYVHGDKEILRRELARMNTMRVVAEAVPGMQLRPNRKLRRIIKAREKRSS